MAIKILMPALSPTMTEGNIAQWLKKEGDKISSGDILVEIETDKATMEVESIDDGILMKILVASGTQGVKVNQMIAVLREEGDSDDDVAAALADQLSSVVVEAKAEDAKMLEIVRQDKRETEKVFASPLARRIAQQQNIDLRNVVGSGPHGRIIKADLINKTPAKSSGSVARMEQLYYTKPHSTIRKVIAKRLLESKQQVPHFYLSVDCNLDALLQARQLINSSTKDYKISVNDLVIKASAMALKRCPQANASWQDDAMIFYNNVDISVAVAIEDGLITPIIRNADSKDLVTISNEMKGLIAKANAGQLKPEEFQGGGFSISNLGMYGVKQFNAIVNPPQACILAVGSAEDVAVVRAGQINIAKVMNLTLSCDHRVVDGALAAQFLGAIKQMIECPMLMLM